MPRFLLRHALVLTMAALLLPMPVRANETPFSTNAKGVAGLNTVPSARMDESGTLRIGAARLEPYNHVFAGMQVTDYFYVNLRQSMMTESTLKTPERVYPGMDFKLRLAKEGRYRPELSFGMDSVLGHKRFSSEYFVLSKRYYDFDFTGGIAWGRMAGGGHLSNPLARTLSRFDKNRNMSDENSASPSDWFAGEKIGFFGGLEYKTPIEDLSLKLEYGPEDYSAEGKRPAPWSVGINYKPKEWISLGAAMIGTDKIMARISFQGNMSGWRGKSYKDSKPFNFDAQRPAQTWRHLPREMAQAEGLNFGKTRTSGVDFSAVLHLNDYQPSTMQIGRAARHLAASAGADIETITVIPVRTGLRGKAVTFSRRDLEQAMARGLGSPEEIWQDVSFKDDRRSITLKNRERKFSLSPQLDASPLEEETTHLYRASVLFNERKEWRYGITTGTGLRLNVADNLHRLYKFRDIGMDAVRSDADFYTYNRVNLNRGFVSWMHTPLPDFHIAATAGYLEEMFAGYGGEILYRPFDSPFAVGAEGWNTHKRDGTSPLALGFSSEPRFTGHLNLFYDVPDTDITAFASAGRFIGGDEGVRFGTKTQLANGIKFEAFMTVTNANSKDVFESDRNAQAGFRISLPFGNLKYVPQGSEARINIAPLGRDDAAMLDKPVSLYEATEPMTYRHLGRNWQAVLN